MIEEINNPLDDRTIFQAACTSSNPVGSVGLVSSCESREEKYFRLQDKLVEISVNWNELNVK